MVSCVGWLVLATCLGQDATALLLAKSVFAKWGDPLYQSSAKVILTSTKSQVCTVYIS